MKRKIRTKITNIHTQNLSCCCWSQKGWFDKKLIHYTLHHTTAKNMTQDFLLFYLTLRTLLPLLHWIVLFVDFKWPTRQTVIFVTHKANCHFCAFIMNKQVFCILHCKLSNDSTEYAPHLYHIKTRGSNDLAECIHNTPHQN